MLTLKGITKHYKVAGGYVEALKGLDISFRKNEFVSILGPSGCGKTTTLNIIGGLDKYTSGDLIIAGKSTNNFSDRDWDVYRNHRIGFVFQSYNLIPHQTVLGNVELALTISGVSKEERVKRAKNALEKVGLKGEEYKRPNQLSGGQCQRVAIARALVNEPDILLADEPTGALDSKTSVQIMELIKEISKEKLVIMVTHNAEIAEQYSTRIVRLFDGEKIEDTNPYSEEEEAKERIGEEKVSVEPKKIKKAKKEKAKMSFWTAFRLSLRNLFTKRGRTILTSFAGSIGIIGIALILAVSQGTTAYINHIQETTLASYPLTLEAETVDLGALIESFMGAGEETIEHDKDAVYKEPIITELVNALSKVETNENDLASFKTYLESEISKDGSNLASAVNGVQYTYDLDLKIYTKNIDNKIVKSDTNKLMTEMITEYMGASFGGGNTSADSSSSSASNSMMSLFIGGNTLWQEMLPGKDGSIIHQYIKDQYDLIDGTWPSAYDEIVLVVNENNELDDLSLYALGLIGEEEIDKIMDAAINGEELAHDGKSWSYAEVRERTYRTILPADCFIKMGETYVDVSETDNETLLSTLYSDALELKVSGIIRPNADSENHMLTGAIGYTHRLTEYVIEKSQESDIVKAQKENPKIDMLTGLPFKSNTGKLTDAEKEADFKAYINDLDPNGKADMYVKIQCVMPSEMLKTATEKGLSAYPTKEALQTFLAQALAEGMGMEEEQLSSYFDNMSFEDLKGIAIPIIQEGVKKDYATEVEGQLNSVPSGQKSALLDAMISTYTTEQCALYYDEVMTFSESTYEDNLVLMGCLDLGSPLTINIYATSFESKDLIVSEIDAYNASVDETKQIKYTDYMGILMSSVTQIVDAISYVLIAFVSISLIVSSIMIGVITLISVQERTKEIGVLRSIGASKKDVSRMFNAETVIIGFAAGLLGILVTYLLCIPINAILYALSGLATLKAVLPIGAAAILVGISVSLTLIAGIIPSRSAAKKDPVEALRTE